MICNNEKLNEFILPGRRGESPMLKSVSLIFLSFTIFHLYFIYYIFFYVQKNSKKTRIERQFCRRCCEENSKQLGRAETRNCTGKVVTLCRLY